MKNRYQEEQPKGAAAVRVGGKWLFLGQRSSLFPASAPVLRRQLLKRIQARLDDKDER